MKMRGSIEGGFLRRDGRHSCRPSCHNGCASKFLAGFTMIEVLVVVAIVALLLSLLLPSLHRARMQARVVKAHHDLRQITIALDGYALINKDEFPPTRESCNTWVCHQLPVELVKNRWLPKKQGIAPQADMPDVFDPDSTYKYRAPGGLFLNEGSSYSKKGSYLFVPDDYPNCHKAPRADYQDFYNDREKSPVAYAVWSVGPDPKSPKFDRIPNSNDQIELAYFPLRRKYWLLHSGDTGLITHSRSRKGLIYTSP